LKVAVLFGGKAVQPRTEVPGALLPIESHLVATGSEITAEEATHFQHEHGSLGDPSDGASGGMNRSVCRLLELLVPPPPYDLSFEHVPVIVANQAPF
jgi:hypothetical protein